MPIPRCVARVRTAPAGVGKTYGLVKWLYEEFLIESDGTVYSNLPLEIETFAEEFAKEYKRNPNEIKNRLVQIPIETLNSWEHGCDPAVYFNNKDLQGAFIILDEAHRFIPRRMTPPQKQAWRIFIGELRHRGGQIELVSQAPSKMNSETMAEMGSRVLLTGLEDKYIRFVGMRYEDLYQTIAMFTHKYTAWYKEEWQDREGSTGWITHRTIYARLNAKYFRLYQSYDVRKGQTAGARTYCYEHGWTYFFRWWFIRNGPRQAINICIILMIVFAWCHRSQAWNAFFTGLQDAFQTTSVSKTPKNALTPTPIPKTNTDRNDDQSTPPPTASPLEQTILEQQQYDPIEWTKPRLWSASTLSKNSGTDTDIVMVGDEYIIMRAGLPIKQGHTIPYGPHAGARLIYIDHVFQRAYLTDGSSLDFSGLHQ